jgi:hypothetical protein
MLTKKQVEGNTIQDCILSLQNYARMPLPPPRKGLWLGKESPSFVKARVMCLCLLCIIQCGNVSSKAALNEVLANAFLRMFFLLSQ